MGFFAVWANIGVVGGVVPDAAGVDGSQGCYPSCLLKQQLLESYSKKIALTSLGSTALIVVYYLTERPDSSPHWPEMAVWPCYVQISSDDLFSSTNHLGNPFLNIYLMEQLKLPMSIFLQGENEVSRKAPEWVANITKL